MIHCNNCVESFIPCAQDTADFVKQGGLLFALIFKWRDNIKNQVNLAVAVHHAEIMHAQPGVYLGDRSGGQITQRIDMRVIHRNRVHVDDNKYAGFFPNRFFRFIDNFMDGDEICRVRNFGMQGRERFACAIVVDDKIMHADDSVKFQNNVFDTLDDIRVGSLPDERAERIAGNAYAGAAG